MAHHDSSYSDDPYGQAMSVIAEALAQATSDKFLGAMSSREYENLEALKDTLHKRDEASYELLHVRLCELDGVNPKDW